MTKGGGKGAPRPKSGGSSISKITPYKPPVLRKGPGSVSGNSVKGTGKGGHK